MRSEARVVLALMMVTAGFLHAEVLERILAVVDDRPLFLSDVRAVETIDHLAEPQALDRLIDETLLVREAARLPRVTTPREEPAPDASSEKVPPSTLRHALDRRAAIRRYVDFRFRSQVRIEDDAVRKAYEAEWSGRPDAPSIEAVSAAIRDRLTSRQVDERVSAWVRDLRTQARIRYNAPDEGPAAGRE